MLRFQFECLLSLALVRGGISSSAAVGVALLMALQAANGIDPRTDVDAWENILMGQRVENQYLGLRTGVLDQASVMLSRPAALTLVDCRHGRGGIENNPSARR